MQSKSNHMVIQTSKLLMLLHLKAPKLLWQMRYPVQNQYEGLTESVGGLESSQCSSALPYEKIKHHTYVANKNK